MRKSNVIRRVSGTKIPFCWRNQHTITTIPYQSFDTHKKSQIKRKISSIFFLFNFFLPSISYLERVLVLQVQRVTGEQRATTTLALDKEAVLVACPRSIELARAQ